LGVGSTYDRTSGYYIFGSGIVCGSSSFAESFTVAAGPGFNLTQIDIALTYIAIFGTSSSASVELLANSGGSPGSTVLGSWTLTGLPADGSVSTIQPSQTISGISGISLTGGTTYWLAVPLAPLTPAMLGTSTLPRPLERPIAPQNGGTTWTSAGAAPYTLNAFDVLETPVSTAVPEIDPTTGTSVLALLIGAVLVIRGRRRKMTQPESGCERV